MKGGAVGVVDVIEEVESELLRAGISAILEGFFRTVYTVPRVYITEQPISRHRVGGLLYLAIHILSRFQQTLEYEQMKQTVDLRGSSTGTYEL